LPRALEGAGFGIVEDVGGVGGLEQLVKALKNKKGKEYEMYKEWLDVDNCLLQIMLKSDILILK